jgi:predicted nuclease of predicted toxin-antitoxin system
MRLFADENFPGPAVRELRSLGHDVVYAKETMRGAADRDVLRAAQDQVRVLLTCDKDFGQLA